MNSKFIELHREKRGRYTGNYVLDSDSLKDCMCERARARVYSLCAGVHGDQKGGIRSFGPGVLGICE